jgi:eukaryotic-like serine/threonine-protein kinase
MPSATGLRKKLNPALLVGLPYREGEVMAERYLVKDAVGVGPLGFVLRAADRELGIDVSVKLVHPRFVQTGEERESFTRALEPARRFLHPSLTRLHDVGNDQGWPYFTYTFLDGLPLRRIIDLRLAKGQTFALDEVEPILGQLMAALEAAHPAGAHGDLKAENILVLPDMLKVTDWGVAAGMPRPPFVQAERQKSAHRHFAPEYLAGLGLEPRADVYSLGVLVGEMLTGLTPEDEIPELRLVNPELPDAIEGFYRRALSERPESRYRSVREMFEAFSAVVEGKPFASPAVAETVVDDGFEVVDFNETQTVVVQPESPAEAAPEASQAAVEIPLPSVIAATEVVAAEVEAVREAASNPAEVTVQPPAVEPEPELETEFWSESQEPPEPERTSAGGPVAAGTLWSGEEDEPAPPEALPPLPGLSLAAAPVDEAPEAPPAALAAVAPPPAVESVPAPEAPPPVRALPTPAPVVPRIGSQSLGAVAVSRPVVPSVGLWGPGARRTGTHAAVAVALSESRAEAEAVAVSVPQPVLPEASAEPVVAAAVRPVPTPAPFAPTPPPAPPASVPLHAVERTPPPPGAHQGGQWSPGAALAELVSEVRSEDAMRLSEPEGEAASAAKAAEVVSEQRASRERLALMSASDPPTVPVASVSGRPKKARPVPTPKPVSAPKLSVRLMVRWGLVFAVLFLTGVAGAILLNKVH